MLQICYNGIFSNDEAVAQTDNRNYTNGFFETIKMYNHKIILKEYHIKRIQKTLSLLQYTLSANASLAIIFDHIIQLCHVNDCMHSGRVRLSFDSENLAPNTKVNYLIKAFPSPEMFNRFNKEGLHVGLFDSIKKTNDLYANLKSANRLLYIDATSYANANGWHDCFIQNMKRNVIESTIANIFWIKNGAIFTPPLDEGCIDGVLRSFLIDQLQHKSNPIIQIPCSIDDLLTADEVFITNAIRGIQWVKSFQNRVYKKDITRLLREQYIAPLLN